MIILANRYGIEAGQAASAKQAEMRHPPKTKDPRDAGQLLPRQFCLAALAALQAVADLIQPEALEPLEGAVEDREFGKFQTA
jgi:hypothetical protein